MKWEQVTSNWDAACTKIKLTWGKFSEADLVSINGDRNRLAAILQERYGYDKQATDNAIDRFARDLQP
jgi:uncharacterized protein YjbJ (UPF0337 family)